MGLFRRSMSSKIKSERKNVRPTSRQPDIVSRGKEVAEQDPLNGVKTFFKTKSQKKDYYIHKEREHSADPLGILKKSTVKKFCKHGEYNRFIMEMLMGLNEKEINTTLEMLGADAPFNGDSFAITSRRGQYSYVGRDYIKDFASIIGALEIAGKYSTRRDSSEPNSLNYRNHGQLYSITENLYPDENGTGTFDEKWEIGDNQNSLLAKTKKLFNENKINTIISAFHTSQTTPYKEGQQGSVYGLSHGRNLLTKAAEESGGSGQYLTNGYNNPYCRVWTHHHQYNQYARLIRPFYTKLEGIDEPFLTNDVEFHKWNQFKDKGQPLLNIWGDESRKSINAWKDDNPGWEHTVTNKDNGLLNITPKYLGGGGLNVHTKDCMFSIENLAWKGYDPYSFEQALSWEQRGPNGGRIMWFPPYGIMFSETTNAMWNANTFIGRGEDVYTYKNTVRQGTLKFMLVVDHPSIIDYVSWNEANKDKVKDTDLLRFFAGCGGEDMKYYATPTPLTDEWREGDVGKYVEAKKDTVTEQIPQYDTIPGAEPMEITFYVFFPNNYAGYYDTPGSEVEAMAYLLAGSGAQKDEGDSSEKWKTKNIPINFSNLEGNGKGYEMKKDLNHGLDKTDNDFITGTSPNWQYNKNKSYVPVKAKKWYYRIDGKYDNAKGNEMYINTYDQTLAVNTNYVDSRSYGLNGSMSAVKKLFPMEDEKKLYSFAEVAYVLNNNQQARDKIAANADLNVDDERLKKLNDYINNNGGHICQLESAEITGYSNAHGNMSNPNNNDTEINISQKGDEEILKSLKSLGDKRNYFLAKNRACSVRDWLKNINNDNVKGAKIETLISYCSSHKVADKDKSNVSGETAKQWRSAKVVLRFKQDSITSTEPSSYETVTKEVITIPGFEKVEGSTGTINGNAVDLYICLQDEFDKETKGRKWYYDETDSEMKVYSGKREKAEYLRAFTVGDKTFGENNIVRYDQEYHFFKALKSTDPVIFDSLMDKIKYFDPAFHSMTPEGFSARLTFLQQCMRQGNTVGASDSNHSKAANNLAFGRQPYCVLRLGDFLNQMIVIDSMNFNYEPLQWDLNEEGVGVIPLLCEVTMSFKFIGGADISGCVRRLQNAMSFNYYANTSLYDNRADRVNPKWDNKTGGALTQGELNEEGNTFYDTPMYQGDTIKRPVK